MTFWWFCDAGSDNGVSSLQADKAMEEHSIVHKQYCAPPMLCVLRTTVHHWGQIWSNNMHYKFLVWQSNAQEVIINWLWNLRIMNFLLQQLPKTFTFIFVITLLYNVLRHFYILGLQNVLVSYRFTYIHCQIQWTLVITNSVGAVKLLYYIDMFGISRLQK